MRIVAVVFLVMIGISACKPIDIRPKGSKLGFDSLPSAQNTIENLMNKNGGLVEWQNTGIVSFKITDEWFNDLHKSGSPWKEEILDVTIDWNTKYDDVRLLVDKTGDYYGIDAGRTYVMKDSVAVQNDKALQKFYLNNLRMVIEMPFRANSADIKKYLGEVEVMGKRYHLVFFSWKRSGPQKDVDQYLMYINTQNARLEYAMFTERASSWKTYTSVRFSAFNTYSGFNIPNQIDYYYNQEMPGEVLGRKVIVKHGAVGVARKKGYFNVLPDVEE